MYELSFSHMFLPHPEDTEWEEVMLQKNEFTFVSLLRVFILGG